MGRLLEDNDDDEEDDDGPIIERYECQDHEDEADGIIAINMIKVDAGVIILPFILTGE